MLTQLTHVSLNQKNAHIRIHTHTYMHMHHITLHYITLNCVTLHYNPVQYIIHICAFTLRFLQICTHTYI